MAVVEIPYKPRDLQRTVHDSLQRWNVIVCHRRFGKTVFAINELIKSAVMCKLLMPRLAYLCPTYKQAKTVAWDYLKLYSQVIPGTSTNEAELRIDYPNGARIQLFGCDNPDALRGIYLDGVVLDEYSQMPQNLFPEVIRPALSDREGWAVFIGTPKGRNAFYELYTKAQNNVNWFTAMYRASETGIVNENELKDAQEIMSQDEYAQEYECSWSAAIKGAIYAKEVEAARKQKRHCFVPIEPMLQVHTFWDLGISDATSIWFAQATGKEIRLINYYENTGEGMAHYINYVKDYCRDNNLRMGIHYAPHDIEVRELTTGKSRKESAREMGLQFQTVKLHKVSDGIEAVRRIFSRCWFDQEATAFGFDCLSLYRREYDEKRKVFRDNPLHDYTSHCSDAFRTMAMAWSDRLVEGTRPQGTVLVNKFNPMARRN